jgi:hypothetical protein
VVRRVEILLSRVVRWRATYGAEKRGSVSVGG